MVPRTAPPTGILRERLVGLASELRTGLGGLLDDVLSGVEVRPVRLTEALGLDKSLASRVTRALRATDPMETMHELPTPQGLDLVVEAAVRGGAGAGAVDAARASVQAYGALLAEFPGGRSDLDTALAAWLPELRERSLRRARREMFRGWSTITGIRSDALYIAYFILPGATPGQLDTAWVSVRQGLRRLRVDGPLELAGLITTDDDVLSGRTSLSGTPLGDDPRAMLVPELSSLGADAFTVVKEPDRILLTLAGDRPDVNEPVDVAVGAITRDGLPRFHSADRPYVWVEAATRQPTECLVLDLFVHREVTFTGAPVVTRIREGTRSYGTSSRPEDLGTQAQVHDVEIRGIRGGTGALASTEIRACEDVAGLVAKRTGVELADLQVSRLREPFPLSTYRTAVWLALPPSGSA